MDRPLERKYKKLQRAHNALVHASRKQDEVINTLMAEVVDLRKQLDNADQRVMIQKQTVIDNIAATEKEKRELINEIMLLKKKLRTN